MYSVVLMMALTSGGDVPAGLFNHGCCGGCYGCYGGCHGSKHHRGHGCCGGCYGYSCCGGGHKHRRGHGCCGGCYGYSCCGGYYGGCCGGSFGGCTGCTGSFGGCTGCTGGVGAPIVPGTVVPTTPATPPAKKTSLENGAPATLVVTVPADARLSIDGEATTSTSTERAFVSPALAFGREYHYSLQAEFQKNGKTVKVSKDVAITAGQETRVTLGADTLTEVASR